MWGVIFVLIVTSIIISSITIAKATCSYWKQARELEIRREMKRNFKNRTITELSHYIDTSPNMDELQRVANILSLINEDPTIIEAVKILIENPFQKENSKQLFFNKLDRRVNH